MGTFYCCSSKANTFSAVSDMTIPKILNESLVLGCKVRISFGSLIKEDTDAVMTVCDIMGYKNKITTEIIKKGGYQVQQELQQKLEENNEIDYGTVISTHGGDLGFDFVFFGVLPTTRTKKHQRQYVFQCVTNTLKQTEILFLNSVSLPVLTISNDSGLSALVYLEETVKDRKNLELINITLEDRDDIDAFLWQYKRIFVENKVFDLELQEQALSRDNCNMVSERDLFIEREQDFFNNFGHAYFEPFKKIKETVGSI